MAKHEAEILLGVEAEAPSIGPAATQAAARRIGLSRRLARGCAVVCAALCVVPALYQATRSSQRTSALEHAIPQQLSELHHRTDFGLVPDTLHVSGFGCDTRKDLDSINGKYHFGGTTGEGRAWYVHDTDRFRQNQKTDVLYYDRQCDGKKGGASNKFGRWQLDSGKKEDWDFERSEMMRVDGKCQPVAEIVVETGAIGVPYYLNEVPGRAPPTEAPWAVWCNDTLVQIQIVTARGTAHVSGHWQFLQAAMPDQRVSVKHGKRERTSKWRTWSADKGGVKVSDGLAYQLAFAQGKASREVTSSLASSWSSESVYSSEVIKGFRLPNGSEGALYQWVLTATTPDKEDMDVLTQSFAVTQDAAHPPRCYPGGSTDGFRCQHCSPGWQLS